MARLYLRSAALCNHRRLHRGDVSARGLGAVLQLPVSAKSRMIRADKITISQGIAMSEPQNRTANPNTAAAEPAFVMDGDGIIVAWSAQAEAVFGWLGHDAVGRRLSELLIPERHRATHEAGLKRFMASGRGALLGRPLELDMLHRDGHEFTLAIRIGAEQTDSGTRFPTWIGAAPAV
jgi:PAS domain S-box-containing protein